MCVCVSVDMLSYNYVTNVSQFIKLLCVKNGQILRMEHSVVCHLRLNGIANSTRAFTCSPPTYNALADERYPPAMTCYSRAVVSLRSVRYPQQ